MSSDTHQFASLSHDISEHSQVSIVDINTIRAQHKPEFINQALSGSFNTKH
jgi:hypothetical protein